MIPLVKYYQDWLLKFEATSDVSAANNLGSMKGRPNDKMNTFVNLCTFRLPYSIVQTKAEQFTSPLPTQTAPSATNHVQGRLCDNTSLQKLGQNKSQALAFYDATWMKRARLLINILKANTIRSPYHLG